MAESSQGAGLPAGTEPTETPSANTQDPGPMIGRTDERRPREPGSEGSPDRRRRRGGGSERRQGAGFGDEVERAFCAHFRQAMPETFPVQHRHTLATRKAIVVARREGIILYCDGVHPGGHAWPDGSLIEPDGANALPDSSEAAT